MLRSVAVVFVVVVQVAFSYHHHHHYHHYHRHNHDDTYSGRHYPNPYSMSSWRTPPPQWHPGLIYDRHTRDRRLEQIVSSVRLFLAYKRSNPFDWRGIQEGYRVLAPLIAVSSSISLPQHRYQRLYNKYVHWRNQFYPGYTRWHQNQFRSMRSYLSSRYGVGWRRYWRPWEDDQYLQTFGDSGTLPGYWRRCHRHRDVSLLPRWMRHRRHRYRRHWFRRQGYLY